MFRASVQPTCPESLIPPCFAGLPADPPSVIKHPASGRFRSMIRTPRPSLERAALVSAFTLFCASGSISAQQPTSGSALEPVLSVEGITEYRLDNGLKVLLFPDPSKPTTTVNITYFVGSRHEAYGETGMAHLLEHLVFKGTPDHPDIPQELTEHGAEPNGTTWYDRTNYFETFPSSDENLEWALDLEADRMINSHISREDLDSEMTVVRNEMEAGENSPFRILMQRTLSTAYLWHNYGKSTIGARSDIENVPIDRLKAFYGKYYQPDNAMLVVAGRFDEARALELIQEKFSVIPAPAREGANQLWETYTSEPTQDGERSVTLERVGDTQVLMHAYHVPPGSHEDFAPVSVLAQVLGDSPSGRLYKALVEADRAAAVGAFAFQFKEAGPLLLFAQVREEDPIDVAAAFMARTVDAVISEPVTEEEVARARANIIKNIELSFNDAQSMAISLSEWEAMGDWRLFFLHRDRVAAVDTEDVQNAAVRYLKRSNRTVGRFLPTDNPDRTAVPPEPNVDVLLQGYEGGEAVAQGEEFDPSPQNIEERTWRDTLPTGFEVALLPKETRGETVVVNLTLRLGSEESLMGRTTDGSFAGGMLMRGTTALTRQDIQDELDRLKTQATVFGSARQAGARIETTRENLPAALTLVADVLKDPAFDAGEFELLRAERLAGLEAQLSDPQAKAITALDRHMDPRDPDHPDYTPTLEELVERLQNATLEGARSFHGEFYNAGAGTLAVVGDFDVDAVRSVVTEAFSDWDGGIRFARIPDPYAEVPSEEIVLETPDKANAFFLARTDFAMTDEHPDYPAMALANFILGGGFLNSRLATRVRQEEGLSYGIGSQFQAHPIDEAATWVAFAIYAPENGDKLQAAITDEIRKATSEGFTADEVEAARSGYLEQRKTQRAQDPSLAGMLGQGLYFDRTMEWEAELDRKIEGLTVEQVNAALARYLDPDRMVIVKAGDFAKAKPVS